MPGKFALFIPPNQERVLQHPTTALFFKRLCSPPIRVQWYPKRILRIESETRDAVMGWAVRMLDLEGFPTAAMLLP
jgi:hypothetical protein